MDLYGGYACNRKTDDDFTTGRLTLITACDENIFFFFKKKGGKFVE